MKRFLFLVLVGITVLMQTTFAETPRVESSPLSSEIDYQWINEMSLLVPTKTNALRDYFTANGVTSNPLTSGLGYGVQVGRHLCIGSGATVGGVISGNVFYSSNVTTNQVYGMSAYFVGRAYFTDSWRHGLFAELGAGPEVSAVSVNDSDFRVQANLSTRVGVGYNYKFNDDITVGATLLVTPSVSSSSYFDNARVVVNLLW